ncbi:hypothetical protein TYRP_015170 [Tyrophagus putrescentiae]|nr:hypothetical protein TYRP_015170 [Tyrophagus putrescentiae]
MVPEDKAPEQIIKIPIDPPPKTSSSSPSSFLTSERKYSSFYYFLSWLTLWWRGILDSIGNIISFFTCRLFNHHRWASLPEDLSGQTVVITGANGGLGKETARVAARKGAKVIFACRNEETTAQAMEEISQEEGCKRENLVFVRLDLSSLASVRAAAAEILELTDQIDVLVNNGGVMMCPKWTTVDGHEYQMGTNYLGHFLFTLLLLNRVKKSPSGGRIVNVASIAYMMGRPWFKDPNLDGKGVYNPLRSYSRSKLYQMLSMAYMAKRLEESGSRVKLYGLHPGVVDTGIVKHFNCFLRGLVGVFHRMVMVSPVIGSQTTLHCAFSDEAGREETGGYYENCRRLPIPPHATDQAYAAQLWELSCRLCGLVDNNNLI